MVLKESPEDKEPSMDNEHFRDKQPQKKESLKQPQDKESLKKAQDKESLEKEPTKK
ncbi:38164_t:CDS:2 [Gigaspora margarita]|uniref:38164_t:CDS:1 n=1 Tax=Gigaspora margarita TaxID=4874 RepID=A0ABN7URM8_GIGMA|nr:38164_t:CDS:2 [Gigaspora margarita]